MQVNVLLTAGLGVVLAIWLKTVWTCCFGDLRKVPGPFLTRFTGLWYLHRVYRGNFHLENVELHKRYGPVVRLAPNLFSIAEPDKTVYGIKTNFTKSGWYDVWKHPDPKIFTLFADRDSKRHADTRRKFQNMYSLSTLKSYESYVDETARVFEARLLDKSASEKTSIIDVGQWMQFYAFDVIGNITYSEPFGFLACGSDIDGTLRALDKILLYGVLVGIYPYLHPLVYKITEHLPGTGAAARKFLMGFVRRRMAQRQRERAGTTNKTPRHDGQSTVDDSPQDFLDKISDAHDRDPQSVTAYHVFMMGFGNVVAGSDTTGISLTSVLFHLVKWPTAMRRLRAEIALYQSTHGVTDLTFEDCQKLPFLQAVIKEALRMHAATGLPMWREVPAGGAKVQGVNFPQGVVVGLNTWVAHYNENIFLQPAEFRPERWLDDEMNELRTDAKLMESHFVPFGLGSRTCLGRHISMLEMNKLIPRLVTRFDFTLEQQTGPSMDAVCYWFVKPGDLYMKVSLRQREDDTGA